MRRTCEDDSEVSASFSNDNEISEKSELKRLRTQVMTDSAKIAELETQIHELKLERDESRNKCSKLEMDIKRLERQQKAVKPAANFDSVAGTLELLEDLLDKQTSDISAMALQRDELVNIIHKLECTNAALAEKLQLMQDNETELNQQISSMKGELKTANYDHDEKLTQVLDKILEIVPEEISDTVESTDTCGCILEIVQLLLDKEPVEVIKYDNTRELLCLSHLEKAVNFVKSVAIPDSCDDTRTFVLSQCARLGQFIDDQCGDEILPNVASLFENCLPEAHMQTVYDFIDRNEDSTPIRELIALFTCTVYINHILFEQLDRAEELKVSQCAYEEALRENRTLRNEMDAMKEKMALVEERISQYKEESDEDLTVTVDNLMQAVETMEQNSLQKTDQIEDMKQHIQELEEHVDTIEQMSIDEYNQVIENLKSENLKLASDKEKAVKAKDQEMRDLREKVKDLNLALKSSKEITRDLRKQLREERDRTENAVKQSEEKMETLVNANDNMQNRIEELQQQADSLLLEKQTSEKENLAKEKKNQAKISNLLHRIEELERVNSETLSNIKTRSSELQEKYDSRIHSLLEELQQSRQQLDDAQSNIIAMNNSKQEQQLQIAKLKLSERTLKLQVKQAMEQMKHKDNASEAKISAKVAALKSDYEARLKDLQDTAASNDLHALSVIQNFLGGDFSTLEDALTQLQAASDNKKSQHFKQLIEDATAIRRLLGLRKKDSLLEAFKANQSKIDSAADQFAALEKKNYDLKRQIAELKKYQRFSDDANAWVKWASSIYFQVTESCTQIVSSEDLRLALGEAILASIGNRKVRRNVELLRTEKRMLMSCGELLSQPAKKKHAKPSIRPLILVGLFTRRLQLLASCLPRQYRQCCK